jgi:8-oxo-dGTP pyrophosphatase MutT (NUDIX family)
VGVRDRFLVRWIAGTTISAEHSHLPVQQVYAWLLTTGRQVVLVSKDGAGWQLPGGKPGPGEMHLQTMLREVKEETGLDLASCADAARLFGYYLVLDQEEGCEYLQLRMLLALAAGKLSFSTQEPEDDPEEGKIRFIQLCPLEEIEAWMPWASAEKSALLQSL